MLSISKQSTTAILLLICSLLLLSSCSLKATKKAPEPLDWQQRQALLSAISNWSMRARIGIRSEQVNGSASLIWDETDGKRTLNLLGPLGGGAIRLVQDADGATLTDSKGRSWQNDNASELVSQATGWKIPLSGLRWWMLGLTEPGHAAEYSFDEQSRLQTITQQGWNVTYNKYASFSNYELPSSITVTTDNVETGTTPVRVKLIVKEWEIKK